MSMALAMYVLTGLTESNYQMIGLCVAPKCAGHLGI